MKKPLQLFCCYAREDQPYLFLLKKHLKPLEHTGLITIQADIDVSPGEEWKNKIRYYLHTAQVIVLLISPDFIASDYCYHEEMRQAIARHEEGTACVVPLIIRPSSWQELPLSKLQALPKDAKPISNRQNADDAFVNTADGIRNVIKAFMSHRIRKETQMYHEEVKKLINLEKYEEALTVLNQALFLDATDTETHALKGFALNQLERYEEALTSLNQALFLDPAYLRAYRQKGFALNQCGRYEEALQALNQLLDLDPTSAIAYARKGFALNELKRYEEALAMLDQALTLDPHDDGWVHMLKGFALNQLERYEEALAMLDRALTLDPTNVQTKGLRNTVLQKFKQQR